LRIAHEFLRLVREQSWQQAQDACAELTVLFHQQSLAQMNLADHLCRVQKTGSKAWQLFSTSQRVLAKNGSTMSRCGFTAAAASLEAWSMSLSDDERDEFNRQFDLMIENGLIEVIGINERGEWLYQATEKGKNLYQAVMDAGLLDQFDWFADGGEE
jgi:hypothetical protein